MMYKEIRESKSGAGAVAGAQFADGLRRAENAAAPAAASESVWMGQGAAVAKSPALQRAKATMQAQQTRYIRGRTFYQNGEQWIDANVPAHPDAKKVQVKFDSDEYYALLGKHADVAQWLSVGRQVQVYLDGTIYEVIDGDG